MVQTATQRVNMRNDAAGKGEQRREHYNCTLCDTRTDAFTNTVRYSLWLCRKCFGKKKDKRPKDLNNLTGKQWASYSRSVEAYPDIRSEKQRIHGAAFPLALAKQQIEMYTKRHQTVFDPFLGVGTTLDAAARLKRKGIGIEINKVFVEMARKDLEWDKENFRVICDDAQNILVHLEPQSVDFLLTSPPYSNLLKTVKGNFAYKWKEHSTIGSIKNPTPYTGKRRDLGNLPYDDFLNALTEIMKATSIVLVPRAYSVWIIKDFRNLKRGIPYVNLHGDVINCAEGVGFQLWDIRIYDQTKFRPLVCLGYPSKNYYLNIGHSYILIFRNR